MTNKTELLVNFISEYRRSVRFEDATDIEYGANGIGQFILITYHEDDIEKVARLYLDEVHTVVNLNGQETYFRNFTV